MAHVLTLAGMSLTSGSYRLVSYVPSHGTGETVTETAEIEVSGATAEELEDNLTAIKRLLEQAKDYGMNYWLMGSPVLLTFQPDGYAEPYHAEVLGGRVQEPRTSLMADWANLRLTVRVSWTRRNWWEGTGTGIGADLALNGSNVKMFLNPGPDGSMPTPAMVDVTNRDATAGFVGVIAALDKTNLSAAYDSYVAVGLNGSGGATIPAGLDTSLYVGGKARSFTLTTTLAKIYEVTNLQSLAGQTWRDGIKALAMSFPAGVGTDVEMQVILKSGGSIWYSGPVVRLTADVVQIVDHVQLPPASAGFGVSVELWARRTTVATALVLDCIYFLPTDGLKVIRLLSGSVNTFGNSLGANEDFGYKGVAGGNDYNVSVSGSLELGAGVPQQMFVLRIPASTATYKPSVTHRVGITYNYRKGSL